MYWKYVALDRNRSGSVWSTFSSEYTSLARGGQNVAASLMIQHCVDVLCGHFGQDMRILDLERAFQVIQYLYYSPEHYFSNDALCKVALGTLVRGKRHHFTETLVLPFNPLGALHRVSQFLAYNSA